MDVFFGLIQDKADVNYLKPLSHSSESTYFQL